MAELFKFCIICTGRTFQVLYTQTYSLEFCIHSNRRFGEFQTLQQISQSVSKHFSRSARLFVYKLEIIRAYWVATRKTVFSISPYDGTLAQREITCIVFIFISKMFVFLINFVGELVSSSREQSTSSTSSSSMTSSSFSAGNERPSLRHVQPTR